MFVPDCRYEFRPRDFIASADNLLFAVVSHGLEDGRVLATLRYALIGNRWTKLSTRAADELISQRAAHYHYYSSHCSANVHGVPKIDIVRHYQPRECLATLMCMKGDCDGLTSSVRQVFAHFLQAGLDAGQFGITGSVLVGRHRPDSDIDLVCYERSQFARARHLVQQLTKQGVFNPISMVEWRRIFERRACELTFDEYVAHERRKWNKGMIGTTKFDITCVSDPVAADAVPTMKLGMATIEARVLDAAHAYDYPSRYRIDHTSCETIVSYTQTYAGQALPGEIVRARGQLEQRAGREGPLRLVIGGSREAPGEYIKVIEPGLGASGVNR